MRAIDCSTMTTESATMPASSIDADERIEGECNQFAGKGLRIRRADVVKPNPKYLQTKQIIRQIAAQRIKAHRSIRTGDVVEAMAFLRALGMGQVEVEVLTPLGTVERIKQAPDLKALLAWLEFAIGRMQTVGDHAAQLAAGIEPGGSSGDQPAIGNSFTFNFNGRDVPEALETGRRIVASVSSSSTAKRSKAPPSAEEMAEEQARAARLQAIHERFSHRRPQSSAPSAADAEAIDW